MFMMSCCLFFFFKQKTAYEMRISDWSSDVCSSDLLEHVLDVGDVLRAQGLRFGVGAEVVVAVRQAEATAIGVGDHARGIGKILRRAEGEQEAVACGALLQTRDHGREIVLALEAGDLGEAALSWRDAGRVDGLVLHN